MPHQIREVYNLTTKCLEYGGNMYLDQIGSRDFPFGLIEFRHFCYEKRQKYQ